MVEARRSTSLDGWMDDGDGDGEDMVMVMMMRMITKTTTSVDAWWGAPAMSGYCATGIAYVILRWASLGSLTIRIRDPNMYCLSLSALAPGLVRTALRF
jgi:hypothetical protein